MNVDSSVYATTYVDILSRSATLRSVSVDEIISLLKELKEVYGRAIERRFLYNLIKSHVIIQLYEEDVKYVIKNILIDKFNLNFASQGLFLTLQKIYLESDIGLNVYCDRVSELLRFSVADNLCLFISLYSKRYDVDRDIVAYANNSFQKFYEEYVHSDYSPNLNINETKQILIFLCDHSNFIEEDNKNNLVSWFRKIYALNSCPPQLLQYLYPNENPKKNNPVKMDSDLSTAGGANGTTGSNHPTLNYDPDVVKFVLEFGPGICSTVEECRATLSTVSAHKFTPSVVARIMIGMLKAQDHNQAHPHQPQNIWGDQSASPSNPSLKDKPSQSSWNGKVFVQAVLDVNRKLQWKDVFKELDFPDFFVKDGRTFRSLIEALKYGLQLQNLGRPEQFPIDAFYKRWRNTDGQIALLKCCLNSANVDVFSFADYQARTINTDMLKITDKTYELKEITVWKIIDLLELLLSLSEGGNYALILEMFKVPVRHCPDLLMVGLIQLTCPMNMLRQELLAQLFPAFFNNNVNSGVILQHAWIVTSPSIRTIMIHSMGEWYLKDEFDRTKLSRILDIAQDLKALPQLLNGNNHLFIIDLACVASRREFLKLDKWLSDKIRENGESFIGSLIKVLSRGAPYVFGKEEIAHKNQTLPVETVSVMMHSLHQCVGKVSRELETTIVSMLNSYEMFVSKNRPGASQPPPGVLRPQNRNLGRLDMFGMNPSPTSGPLFGSPVDTLAGLGNLGSSFGNLNLGSTSSASSGGTFGINTLTTPGSPSRSLGPNFSTQNSTSSAFSMIQGLPMAGHGAPNASASSAMLGSMNGPLGLIGNGRIGSNPSSVSNASSLSVGSDSDKRAPTTGTDPSVLFTEMQTNEVSKEAEEEANQYFHRIYSKPPDPFMSTDDALEMLKKYKDSTERKEREVFAFMLRNLFEEYKFFNQYPDKELQITAKLFGGIIEHGLVSSYMQLGVALRLVVDALKKSPGSKMYTFGLAALDKFKGRLKEYPQYCNHLSSIPHSQEFPSVLKEYIEYGQRSLDPPTSISKALMPPVSQAAPPPASVTKPVVSSTNNGNASTKPSTSASGPSLGARPSIANATNINTLLVATEKSEATALPPESIQDKTAFIFNNLNQMNLVQKCEELKEVVGNDYWPWLAQYLVMKRASLELNFHTLYFNLLDQLKSPELSKAVLKETHRNIGILLKADKSNSNFSDRALLKNLGHWLGMITLMKNKPIILDDLEIKHLIIEAYRKGIHDLQYIVPFAAKIMESCGRSICFKPPCPWTMQIMKVLSELHAEPDMKLNLKFEIEVLCKALGIEISELKPTSILKADNYKIPCALQLSYPSKVTSEKALPETVPQSRSIHSVATHQPQQQQQQANVPSTPAANRDDAALVTRKSSSSPVQTVTSSSNQTFLPPSSLTTVAEPKFSYADVDTSNLSSVMSHVQIDSSLHLFQSSPSLKTLVHQAVEKAIYDLIGPVVERSIKYTINACENVIRKDFALDSDDSRMRRAAHHMMRYLTAGMAMITSRDHIFHAISNNLKELLTPPSVNLNSNPQMKETVEQTAATIANDNMELACVFIQKTAVEKALTEIDKRLNPEYDLRKQAKMEGRMYCDTTVMAYQMERMPEIIRVKPATQMSQNQQLAVYEDFSRNIPGFLPPTEGEIPFMNHKSLPSHGQHNQGAGAGGDDHVPIYDKLATEVSNFSKAINISNSPSRAELVKRLRALFDAIIDTSKTKSQVVAAINLLQKAVEGLLEGLAIFSNDSEIMRYRDAHLMVLKALQDPRAFGQQWVNRQVTKCLIECRPEFKYNVEGVDTLIRANLVNMLQFDANLAGAMDKGTNLAAVNFAMRLVQMYLVDERYPGNTLNVNESDLYHTVDMLARIATINRQHPDGLVHLIDVLRSSHDTNAPVTDRAPGGPSQMPSSNPNRDIDDPQGLVEKSELLFREWIRLYLTAGTPKDSSSAFNTFIVEITNTGILKSDDIITRFFRICVQCCANQAHQGMQTGSMPVMRSKCYQSIDALVRLVSLLVKHIGDNTQIQTKINLLNKFLGIIAGLLIQEHDSQKTEFRQLPYHRLLIMFFYDLNIEREPAFESINGQVLCGFSNTLHLINPSKVPGFAFSWLEIIGNRLFIAKMLALASDPNCWALYCHLLLDLFKFMQPFLRNAELAKPVASLYRGTLRVLLVILHDFPDFLCDYCYHFLDVIPPNCIQMRNLVLSAFPRNMRLPDPFTANLKFEMLADTAVPPRMMSNVDGMIQPAKFKQDLDSYLKTRAPVTFLSELRTNLQVTNDLSIRYNIPLLYALVLYVGSQHIQVIRQKGHSPNLNTVAHTSHMDIFQNLAVDLDTEGRYLFLNALANQLRFPSSHTHYFSLVILYLFAQSNTEVVQEQITRVLLERLVVNRPHPWGLLVTFIELIKNQQYKFWQHEFVHCAPEVEKLFESVARSCMVNKNTPLASGVPQTNIPLSNSSQPVAGPNGPTVLAMDNNSDILSVD